MQLASQLGDGGIEIVGPMHHRCWPRLSDEFERQFKSSVERYGLKLTSHGAYCDIAALRNWDEAIEHMVPQLEATRRLGFPLIRIQYPVDPVVEKLLPYAEKFGINMFYEIHSPFTFEYPQCQALIEHVKKISSPRLGLEPDCGIFEKPREQKPLPGNPAMKMPEFQPSDPKRMKEIMPFIMHLHGKFHWMENGQIPHVPFEEITQALVEGGFKGWMSTEFEGSELGAYPDSFEIVKAHHALVRGFIAKYARG
jgi:sugar phosphate isomerase/epimerase